MGFHVSEALSQSKGIHQTFKSGCKHSNEASQGECYRSLAHDGRCLATMIYTVTKHINKLCIHVMYRKIMGSKLDYAVRTARLLSSELGSHMSWTQQKRPPRNNLIWSVSQAWERSVQKASWQTVRYSQDLMEGLDSIWWKSILNGRVEGLTSQSSLPSQHSLCTAYGRKISPFPLSIALMKGGAIRPETSSGCIVTPSFTAWYPFRVITGAHSNHEVYMLPKFLPAVNGKGTRKEQMKPHTSQTDATPAIHWPNG